MAGFVRAISTTAIAHHTAYCTENCTGVALCLPPNVEPDEAIISEALADSTHAEMHELSEQSAGYRPSEPHWYLPVIGVDPAYQGRGLGRALMAHACERCDRDGVPFYLESSNPRNIPLYQRHGFEVLGTIQAARRPRSFSC